MSANKCMELRITWLENHYSATANVVITDPGQAHQWMPKPLINWVLGEQDIHMILNNPRHY